jgi:5-formyltetrahydrofolate cyclo-ligase
MTKAELRKKYKALRSNLSLDQVDSYSMDIANRLLSLDIWSHTYYHLFLSIAEHKEVQTEFILNILHAKDKEIVVSKSNFDTQTMTNYLLTDNTVVKKNHWDIPEPVDGIEVPNNKIDVVFVPLLAFDNQGNRVGYGKGFYDKFLNSCSKETVKIGLSFFEAEETIDDVSTNDVPLDYCVTPEKVYHF